MIYTGTLPEGTLIADGTNPWIEVDGKPVDWTVVVGKGPCPCGENGDVALAGVLDGMDTADGVQRCDTCGTYEGDLDAALALAELVGGTVHFETEEND